MVATCTADTISGFGLRLVISQLEAVSNIAAPTAEIELAIRMTVKARWRNTPQGEGGEAEGSGVETAWEDTGAPAPVRRRSPPALVRGVWQQRGRPHRRASAIILY